jgi:hypothetical protein
VDNLFSELDKSELKSEAHSARLFVYEHQDEFKVPVDPKKPEKGKKLCLITMYGRLYSGDVCLNLQLDLHGKAAPFLRNPPLQQNRTVPRCRCEHESPSRSYQNKVATVSILI